MTHDIATYGAIADGSTLNTAAIQGAIDSCHEAGGGQVVCGPGAWLTGSLELRSHVHLYLAPGCRLLGSPDLADYSPLIAEGFHHKLGPEHSSESLVRAIGAEDIAITGPGTIDGGGLAFYDQSTDGKLEKPPTPRPRLVMFYQCRNVRLLDTTFTDSACWSLWLMQCADITIQRLTITGNRRMRNVDGIDLDACRNATVSDCRIHTEDDCLVLRAIQHLYDAPAVCENITVTNCLLDSGCQGVRIGCPGDAVIRDATFSNLVIRSANNGIVSFHPRHYLPEGNPGSADISRLLFANCTIDCRRTPIQLAVADGIALPRLADIAFSDLRIRSGLPCLIQGCPETTIEDIRFANVQVETTGDDAILCRRCKGIRLTNVDLTNQPDTGANS